MICPGPFPTTVVSFSGRTFPRGDRSRGIRLALIGPPIQLPGNRTLSASPLPGLPIQFDLAQGSERPGPESELSPEQTPNGRPIADWHGHASVQRAPALEQRTRVAVDDVLVRGHGLTSGFKSGFQEVIINITPRLDVRLRGPGFQAYNRYIYVLTRACAGTWRAGQVFNPKVETRGIRDLGAGPPNREEGSPDLHLSPTQKGPR